MLTMIGMIQKIPVFGFGINNYKQMKKTLLYFFCVLLPSGAMLTACSSDDSESEQISTKIVANKTYYLAINAAKRGGTRALNPYDSKIETTWNTTENIYVKYSDSWFTGALHPNANNATAYLSGAITSGESIGLPATMTLQFPRTDIDYTEQDGTLDKIATHYDYATAEVNVTNIVNQNLNASEFVDFDNLQAIAKFTLKGPEGNPLNVSNLRISATDLKKTDTSTGDITITPSSATNEMYAALSGINDAQVTLTATVNTGGTNSYYVYRKDNVTFANGTYQPISVKMRSLSNGVDLANIDPGYIGWVVGSDGKVYAKSNEVPSGQTAVAMIAYVYKDDTDKVHGLAIALKDESSKMTQASAVENAPTNHQVPTGASKWKLPNRADWKNMFTACGSASTNESSFNYTCFNSKLATVGTALQSNYYWSSIDDNYLFFNGTEVDMSRYDGEGFAFNVRVCLEF